MGRFAGTRLCSSSSSSLVSLSLLSLLFCLLQSLSTSHVAALNYTKHKHVSSLRLQRIQRHLSLINKHPILTVLSPDGDIIDCIDIRKQPAFDHPFLKNHKIQRVPPKWPKVTKVELEGKKRNNDEKDDEGSDQEIAWQLWHHNGTRCPKRTVPVRRSTLNDVRRAKSLYDFGKKRRRQIPFPRRRVDAPDVAGYSHEHAIAYTGTSEKVYGAKATINVWGPWIEEVNEFSLSQIWVLSGSFDGSDLNSIEAGWQVSPELYGDTRPRLFTYWTSDSYGSTGCYNLLCAGFIQTSHRISIGAAISPVSGFAGNQYDITLLIWKDPNSGNWWLGFGEGTLVGYWPAELFTHLADDASMVEWGGEVVDTRATGAHTTTQMGSGHFAGDGFGKASYFKNLKVVDSGNNLVRPHDLLTVSDNANCYDINSDYSNDWGAHFYYGGPGRNPNCP
ncbi:hypothetical protein V2J09_019811 [Rumex salicifolius]